MSLLTFALFALAVCYSCSLTLEFSVLRFYSLHMLLAFSFVLSSWLHPLGLSSGILLFSCCLFRHCCLLVFCCLLGFFHQLLAWLPENCLLGVCLADLCSAVWCLLSLLLCPLEFCCWPPFSVCWFLLVP